MVSKKLGEPPGARTLNRLIKSQHDTIKLLNNLPLATLAALSNYSKSYLCQVRKGQRPASPKLLDIVQQYAKPRKQETNYITLFLESREAVACSKQTLRFYRILLSRYSGELDYLKANPRTIERYLNSIKASNNNVCTRHAYYRALRAFYNWLQVEYGMDNPMKGVRPPILSKVMLPALTDDQVKSLIESADNVRDQAIISLFTESGLRLAELTGIKPDDIDWQGRCIKVLGKGRKTALAPFGALSESYLRQWLAQYQPNGNIWGLNAWGITSMLRRLEAKTGITCNPHTFRRTFAVLLRKAGIDTMTIKELGRWESLEMVQRYTRSFRFQDSMKFYKSPLSN
jgi:site-specific recombinase XerD